MKFPIAAFLFVLIIGLIQFNCERATEDSQKNAGSEKTASVVSSKRIPIRLGETAIYVDIFEKRSSSRVYFNMHDDENTAVEAAKSVVKKFGGKLIELQSKGERLITFSLNSQKYVFDPNRIFTEIGIDSTLARHSKLSKEAHTEIARFVSNLFQILFANELQCMVTVHNNGENGYSIKSYQAGGVYERDAEKTFANPERDPDDFFFVTKKSFFEYFKNQGQNVVLQNNDQVTDDGSLSVYCGERNIPYINVETQHGHLQRQIAMLEKVHELLNIAAKKQEYCSN
ncbi:MAG: protein tyrosine phosphatase [bacterium]